MGLMEGEGVDTSIGVHHHKVACSTDSSPISNPTGTTGVSIRLASPGKGRRRS